MSLKSLVVLELLSWQLSSINEIINSTSQQLSVQTIAFFGSERDVEPFVEIAPDTPKLVVTETFGSLSLSYGVDFNRHIFFVGVGMLGRTARWHHMNEVFKDAQSHTRGVFIIRPPKFGLSALLDHHFRWCWRNGFTNVLVLVERTDAYDIYGFNPFPELKVVALTSQDRVYFPDKFLNLMSYKLRSPAIYSPPHVFEMPLAELGEQKRELKGYATSLVKTFLDTHNGSLEVVQPYNNSKSNMLDVIEYLKRGVIDMSMNPFVPFGDLTLSYPMRMVVWSAVVPNAGEIEPFSYFTRAFTVTTWLSCIGILFYLSIARSVGLRLLLSIDGCPKWDLGASFLEVLRLMLFVPISVRRYDKKLRLTYAVYFVLSSGLGFMLTNLYVATVTSFLATMIFQPQVNTLSEMVERNFKIWTIDYEIPVILGNRGLPKGFADRLMPCSSDEFTEMLLHLNLSENNALIAREDLIQFALYQQKFLSLPPVHVASESITTVPLGFPLPEYSPFGAALYRFILKVADAGLNNKWSHTALIDGLRARIITLRKDDSEDRHSLSLKNLQFAWLVLAAGYACSGLILISEKCLFRLQQIRVVLIRV